MSQSRRNFIKAAALATAGFTIVPRHVLGGNGYVSPSDQVALGVIGLGRMGLGLGRRFTELEEPRIVAICDVDKTKVKRFSEFLSEKTGEKTNSVPAYGDFRELIARDDLDGVLIATPDHWHAYIAIAAMKEGLDIYCEKPMAHTVKEGRAMVKATRKYNRVFQVGSMQRSRENFRHACELVRNGYIGEVKEVKVWLGTPPVAVPCDLPPMDEPDFIDWNFWLGPAQVRGYHSDLAPLIPETFWGRWRYYKEFGGGMLSDWGAHMFDIAQWGLGMDESGPVEFNPPLDPKAQTGLRMKYANGIEMIHEDFGKGNAVRFIGSEGTLDVSRSILESDPANIVEKKIGDNETRLYKSDNHYQDFISAMKSRKKPICDVETGHRTATICNIANITYQLGRPLKWDPEKEKFIGDSEANKLRTKEYRKPWKV